MEALSSNDKHTINARLKSKTFYADLTADIDISEISILHSKKGPLKFQRTRSVTDKITDSHRTT